MCVLLRSSILSVKEVQDLRLASHILLLLCLASLLWQLLLQVLILLLYGSRG